MNCQFTSFSGLRLQFSAKLDQLNLPIFGTALTEKWTEVPMLSSLRIVWLWMVVFAPKVQVRGGLARFVSFVWGLVSFGLSLPQGCLASIGHTNRCWRGWSGFICLASDHNHRYEFALTLKISANWSDSSGSDFTRLLYFNGIFTLSDWFGCVHLRYLDLYWFTTYFIIIFLLIK